MYHFMIFDEFELSLDDCPTIFQKQHCIFVLQSKELDNREQYLLD